MIDPMTGEIIDHKELAESLLEQAREQGVSLLGPGWTVGRPDEERARDRVGGGDYRAPRPREARCGRERERAQDCFYGGSPVAIDVPRDREGSFEPQIVKKRL